MSEGYFIKLEKYHVCLYCAKKINKELNFCSNECKKEDIARHEI